MMRRVLMCSVMLYTSTAWTQNAVTSAGAQGAGGDLLVAWSIGEPIIATGTSASVVATQGFHQPPADFNVAVILRAGTPATWQLYPNPTRDILRFSTTEQNAYHAEVINAVGQRTHLWPITASNGQWSVGELASGAYHLRVLDRAGNELRSLEFIVTQ